MEKSKVKIAVLSFYSGITYRGVETYVHEFANLLTDRNYDITVYQAGPQLPGSKYKTTSLKIKTKVYTSGGDFGVFLNMIIDLFAVAKFTINCLKAMDHSTDILIPTNNRVEVLLCKLWSLGKRVKLVVAGHAGPGLDDKILLWTFPDVFIALSNWQLNWARNINSRVKLTKISNGIDLHRFSGNIKPIYFGLEKPIVLCVAALWPSMKRQHLLIKAMRKVKKGSLLLVGTGEGKEYLNKMGKKLLGGRFLIKSYKYEEMPAVYASCDLFSYPTSKWESFGIVLTEAMASGLPVVATDDPIRREIVGEAGLFVDPENSEEYARAIVLALNQKWGNKPRLQANKFSWDEVIKQYESLFVDLSKN
jgi:glycosyltransferase involved in cell wall biosynthesis